MPLSAPWEAAEGERTYTPRGSLVPRGRTGSGSIAQCGAAGDVRLVRQQSGLALEHRGVDGG